MALKHYAHKLLGLTGALMALTLTTEASAQQIVTENGRAYKTHTVQKGEGLYRLSVENGVTQEEIVAANPILKTKGLIEGMTVRIPLKETPKTESVSTSDEKHKVPYTVQRGETSYSISKSNGMSITDFLKLNPDAVSGIVEGQTVYILTNAPQKVQGEPVGQSSTMPYTVRKGETSYSIATSNGISLVQFLKLNPQCANGIHEGDVVMLPMTTGGYVTHIIVEGETLYGIGVKYGVKADQIMAANEALNPASLPVGTAIRIPSSRIPEEDDSFTYHRTKIGETLYSICMKYDVMLDKVKMVNPGVDWNALHVGQVVAVPKSRQNKTTYTTHEVQKKETMFSIAHKYDISVEELSKANNNLSAGDLKKGMLLQIPHVEEGDESVPATSDPNYVGNETDGLISSQKYDYVADGRPTINVCLMLPFNAANDMRDYNNNGKPSSNYTFKSHRYVEFYEGVRLALDSMNHAGANIKLNVMDVNSRTAAENILSDMAKPDIIIGPARQQEMLPVMQYAKVNKVPVVLPFAQADSSILDNPYVFQASFIDSITTKNVTEQMVKDMKEDYVIIISPKSKNKRDLRRLADLKKKFSETGTSFVEHDYTTDNTAGFLALLREDKRNVIVIPTTNEARINSVVTSIASIMDQKPTCTLALYGTSEWIAFQTIEVEVFHKLNTTIYTTFATDYADPKIRHILQRFRSLYFTEPVAFMPYFQKLKDNSGFSEYGMWGYDVAFQFVGGRINLGPDFVRSAETFEPTLLQSNFHLHSLTNWGGSVNVGLKTVTFTPDGKVTVNKISTSSHD